MGQHSWNLVIIRSGSEFIKLINSSITQASEIIGVTQQSHMLTNHYRQCVLIVVNINSATATTGTTDTVLFTKPQRVPPPTNSKHVDCKFNLFLMCLQLINKGLKFNLPTIMLLQVNLTLLKVSRTFLYQLADFHRDTQFRKLLGKGTALILYKQVQYIA